ncbi:MAG: hypothetical protein Kow0037_24200 [Calditrichia bacterium]
MGIDEESKKPGGEQPDDEVKKDLDEILGKLKETDGEQPAPVEPQKTEPAPEPAPAPSPAAEEEEGLETILEKISEVDDSQPAEELSVVERIVGIFTQPARVFQYLRAKPDVWVPLILTILISVGVSFLVYDIALDDQIAKFEQNEKITPEQRDMIVDSIEQSREGGKRIIYTTVLPALSVLFIFFVVGGIFFFIGNVILGGKAKYLQVVSAYGYAYLIMAILGTAIKLPLILIKKTINVHTDLSLLVPGLQEGGALFNFLASLDIFTIWSMAVFGIGFAIIYRFTQQKGIISVFTAWLLYVLVFKVALGSLLAGFGG